MGEWIATTDAMPVPGQRVLFAWRNHLGKTRVSAGSWLAANTIEAWGDQQEEAGCTYDEGSGIYYVPEGWREWGWTTDYYGEPDDPPTHWMPIPLHPDGKGDE